MGRRAQTHTSAKRCTADGEVAARCVRVYTVYLVTVEQSERFIFRIMRHKCELFGYFIYKVTKQLLTY